MGAKLRVCYNPARYSVLKALARLALSLSDNVQATASFPHPDWRSLSTTIPSQPLALLLCRET